MIQLELPPGLGQPAPSTPLLRVGFDDCPWWFAQRWENRKDNAGKKNRHGPGAHVAYSAQELNETGPLMKVDEICGLGEELRHIWAEDAYRFMWIPPSIDAEPGVRDRVMDAWGFKCINYGYVWVKINPRDTDRVLHFEEGGEDLAVEGEDSQDHYGMGHYTRNGIEICYLGIKKDHRGRTKRMWHSKHGYRPNNIVRRPIPRYPRDVQPRVAPDGKLISMAGKPIHSRKPDEPQLRTTRWLEHQLEGCLMGELFATRRIGGYVCLGHALSGLDIRKEVNQLWKP